MSDFWELEYSVKCFVVGGVAFVVFGIMSYMFEQAKDIDSAWNLLHKGDLHQAIRIASRAIKFGALEGERLSSAYECRAAANIKRKLYERALEDLDRVVELRPEYHGGYLLRGDALVKTGNLDKALIDLNRGLEIIDPKGDSKSKSLAAYYIDRGNIYLDKKELQKAMADFDRALQLDENSIGARMGRSYVLEAQGLKLEALKEMELVWQSLLKRSGAPISVFKPYVDRVVYLRILNGFEGSKPAPVLSAEKAP